MHTNKRLSVSLLTLTNIIFLSLIQLLFVIFPHEKIDFVVFQLVYFPLIILSINLIFWFSRFRIDFFLHWICIYIGYFCSILTYYFIEYLNVDPLQDVPPGEAYFDLFLFTAVFVILQIIILLILNGVTFILKIGFSYLMKRFA